MRLPTGSLWRFFYPTLHRSALTADQEAAFLVDCDERLGRQSDILFGVIIACNLLWWPTDHVVFGTVDHWGPTLVASRVALLLMSASYLVLSRLSPLRRWRFWLLTVAAFVSAAIAGRGAGALGGPEECFFHPLYVVLFASVPLPLPLRKRVLVTVAICVGLAGGYFLPHLSYLSSPQASLVVSFLVFSNVISIWFGHIQFLLSRDNHAQAHELAEHGRLLESRVEDRTRELRDLLDYVETLRETERTHIARELHDELGQELSALRYSLSFTKTRYGREPDSIAANLQDLDGLLRRTTQTTRNLVTDLRPRVIDDLGLEAAVEWLVERTHKRGDLACELTVRGELSATSPRAAMTAFRLVQEALTNVGRHAQATRVDIRITSEESELTIVVLDDGIGIDASRAAKGGAAGVGLLGMRERVHAVGGTLVIRDRSPERGTEVRCQVPCFPMSVRPALVPAMFAAE
ncbi:MAG: sensor histidine kinase [Polyangiaceae bacterium]